MLAADPSEQARFWTSPDLDGLELLWGDFRRQCYRPHVHEGYVLGVVTRGVETFRCRGEAQVAGLGDIIVINPDTLHDGEAGAEGGWQYRVIYPREALLVEVARQLGERHPSPPRFGKAVIKDPPLARMLVRLHRLLEGPASALESRSLWVEAVERLIRLHGDRPLRAPRRPRERAAVARVKDYLAGNLAGSVSLFDVASVVGLSPCHLQRVFKEETGLSPHAFLTYRRARRAKDLIQAGTPIAEAAVAAGFADQAHLTRRFKAVFGFTPGQYRCAFAGR